MVIKYEERRKENIVRSKGNPISPNSGGYTEAIIPHKLVKLDPLNQRKPFPLPLAEGANDCLSSFLVSKAHAGFQAPSISQVPVIYFSVHAGMLVFSDLLFSSPTLTACQFRSFSPFSYAYFLQPCYFGYAVSFCP